MQPLNFHVAENVANIKHYTFVVLNTVPAGV